MKALLKRLLPPPAIHALVTARQRLLLSRVAPLACDTGNLRPIAQFDPARVFSAAPEVARRWDLAAEVLGRLHPEDIPGGVNAGDRRALYYLVSGLGARSVLEIGTHVGASTVHLAKALRDSGAKDARLVTVDIRAVNAADGPWRAAGLAAAPAAAIAALGCEAFTEFREAPALGYLAGAGPRFDLIFLDGDHSAAAVYREIPAALQRLNPGGIIVLHDYFPALRPLWRGGERIPGPWLAVSRLRREHAALQALPLGALPWPTKLGSQLTSLAVLLR